MILSENELLIKVNYLWQFVIIVIIILGHFALVLESFDDSLLLSHNRFKAKFLDEQTLQLRQTLLDRLIHCRLFHGVRDQIMHRLADKVVLTSHFWIVNKELFRQLLNLSVQYWNQLEVQIL